METEKNLVEMQTEISNRLLDSIRMLEVLDDLIGAEPKEGTVISYLTDNMENHLE